MKLYRLSRKRYSLVLSGKGAAKSNNRWNSKGVELIYTSESRALAMTEVLVHLSPFLIPADFVMLEIDVPNELQVLEIAEAELTQSWNSHPPLSESQKIGDAFIHAEVYPICKVPSAVVSGDHNYLINPHHPQFERISVAKVEDFSFDRRFF